MQWTTEQQKVIDTRDCALLVSAAAGSGKTAVLVERIIQKITGENPVDIDRMLIVTFTNAAAAEMRERIGKAITKELEKDPENEHLQRQNVLIHHAQITTIHSFCLQVIHNYFHKTDRDPSFRIADEGEMSLASEDVLDQVLERWYEAKTPEFQILADSYATAKGDSTLRNMVLELDRYAMSHPWPKQWLLKCLESYQNPGEILQEEWMNFFVDFSKSQAKSFYERYERLVNLCAKEPGFEKYAASFSEDLPALRNLTTCETYEEFQQAFQMVSFVTKPRRSKKDIYDVSLDEWVTASRNNLKKQVTTWRDTFFGRTLSQVQGEICGNEAPITALIGLTLDYEASLAAYKKEKNMIDFGDIEHDALSILVEQKDGENVPSDVARQYQDRFDEIMIDEYQDSNEVQEMILTSISGYHQGRPNLFMVGDVKQSIYKFRLAKPELFMEKYHRFRSEGSEERKIELDRNFRSRAQVLTGINYIFRQIMQEVLGGIDYTDKQALYPGAFFEETAEEVGGPVEMMLLDMPEESLFGDRNYTKQEWEAKMIAARIHELTDPITGKKVWDKEEKCYRPARFGDIVILLRAVSGWTEPFISILNEEGIPASTDSQSGYFSAREVQVLLNYLRILDNPMQDIPLASVLTSEMVGLNSRQMAEIKVFGADGNQDGFYGKICFYREHTKTGEIHEKLEHFFAVYEYLKKRSIQVSLFDLLSEIYEETGYLNLVTAMPQGEKRRANLMMLLEKAKNYEKMSYRGLFRFVRYIEKLEKYEIDFSEAMTGEGEQNVVRIMSIHKSKGLEFPIVFLSGMQKKFNEMDLRKHLMVHPDLGFAMDVVDPVLRTKKNPFMKQVLAERARQENKGEELRILYVAMTRAKELLIMTAAEKNLEDRLSKLLSDVDGQEPYLSYHQLISGNSYLEWVLPAMCKHPSAKKFLLPLGIAGGNYDTGEGDFSIRVVTESDLMEEKVQREQKENTRIAELIHRPKTEEEVRYEKKMQEHFTYQYPYEMLGTIHSTMSVSELKKRSMEEAESPVTELVENCMEEPLEVGVWDFAEEPEGDAAENLESKQKNMLNRGAIRGDAFHHFMAEVPMKPQKIEELKEEKARQLAQHILSEEEGELINLWDIYFFLKSDLGKRMELAEQQGKLFREKQFMMGLHPSQIRELNLPEVPAGDEEEYINIQGIIDCYWEEEDGLVLMDYKTDWVLPEEGREVLLKRYTSQLHYYQMALEMYTGKKVKEKMIYSFSLKKAIAVPEN